MICRGGLKEGEEERGGLWLYPSQTNLLTFIMRLPAMLDSLLYQSVSDRSIGFFKRDRLLFGVILMIVRMHEL